LLGSRAARKVRGIVMVAMPFFLVRMPCVAASDGRSFGILQRQPQFLRQ